MGKNEYIELSIWVVSIALMLFFIPRARIREAAVSFMFTQLLSWILGYLVVYFGLLSYPKHFFATATDTSFTYEFLAFPAISAIMNVHFPTGKPVWLQIGYWLLFPTVLTLVEIVLVHYTNLILYIHWAWYISWISIAATMLLAFAFHNWFVTGSWKRPRRMA
ncbi:MAG: hypothetical protein K0R75_1496 [Paenibacillaceae bacterium]|jgi:hypothetical protein|nr:hypothetical protein [Paenibacillaceae bacterium]